MTDKIAASAESVLEALADLTAQESGKVPTAAFKRAASQIVELRSLFVHEGLPDWSGRSMGYRDLIERLYREAAIPPDSDSPIQGKVRYHVGNELRKVAPNADLAVLGLSKDGPGGRAAEKRATGKGRRRPGAVIRRTRLDDPLVVAAIGLDAIRLLRSIPTEEEDRDMVESVVRSVLDEAFAYLKGDPA